MQALVLSDTATRIGTAETWDERIRFVQENGLKKLAAPSLQRWFTARFRERRRAQARGFANMMLGTSLEGYTGTCYVLRDTDLTQESAAIDKPTLVLCGEEDIATPPVLVRALTEVISGSQYCEIEQAAHLPCVEQPYVMAQRMKQFFREVHVV